jgi:hypothetical protein
MHFRHAMLSCYQFHVTNKPGDQAGQNIFFVPVGMDYVGGTFTQYVSDGQKDIEKRCLAFIHNMDRNTKIPYLLRESSLVEKDNRQIQVIIFAKAFQEMIGHHLCPGPQIP